MNLFFIKLESFVHLTLTLKYLTFKIKFNIQVELSQEAFMDYMETNLIPFCVVGSERSVVINGKAVRGRRTRFGLVDSKRKI